MSSRRCRRSVTRNRIHATDLVHREYDPSCDSGMRIDLENLPDSTPTMGFEATYNEVGLPNTRIPLFVAGPMVIFRLQCENQVPSCFVTFIRNMPADRRKEPTPENPDCDVCCLVKWLLTECRNYEECFQRLYYKPQTIVYEIMKEVWLRFCSKPILLSRIHVQVTKQINFLTIANGGPFIFPGDPKHRRYNLDWELKKAHLVEWRNALVYTLRRTLACDGMQNDVANFLILNIVRILRIFVASLIPMDSSFEACDEYLILDSIHHFPLTTHPILMLFATDLSNLLLRLDDFWNVNLDGREACAPDNQGVYDSYTFIASLNLLLMNETCAFYKSSFSDPSTKDLTMNLLADTLLAFSRLVEVLRFAEVVPWVGEVLCYLEVAFVWDPTLVLDAALNVRLIGAKIFNFAKLKHSKASIPFRL
ncbi:unnamed protein product [Hydatigera taeniaeformis]|uniref:Uncharacterized protein n=1 Tax=Hydatigena taeniaeformis TaxID=6205 RepID=A0A0R3WSJ6_HYDTA|nr:unnamed protein product [Hydatigera taeniaeformis]